MLNKLITFFLLFIPFILIGQINNTDKGAAIIYTKGAPTGAVRIKYDSEWAIDINTSKVYRYDRTNSTWILAGSNIGYLNSTNAPTGAPKYGGPEFIINNDKELYWYYAGSWQCLNCGIIPYVGGTGINVTGNTITNTLPDQTVVLSNGTGISVTGTYPNFTITNTAPDQTVTITGAGISNVTGTYPNFTITSTEVDGSITNEIQTIDSLILSGDTLIVSLSSDGVPASRLILSGLTASSGGGIYGPSDTVTYQHLAVIDSGLTFSTTEDTGYLNIITAPGVYGSTAHFHPDSIRLRHYDIGGSNELILNDDGVLIKTTGPDRLIIQGADARYAADYRATYSARSFIDKQYGDDFYLQTVDTFRVSNDTLYISLARDSVPQSFVVLPTGSGGGIDLYELDIITPLPPVDVEGSMVLKTVDINGSKYLYISNGTDWVDGGLFLDTLNVATIHLGNDQVTYAKIQEMGDSTLLGNPTSSTANPVEITLGTGLRFSSGSLINTAPDQTVVLNNGTGISVTGTYPNFTITNSSPNVTTDLTFTGASSPYTLNSSDGTDVTFAEGAGITLSRLSNELTISAIDQSSTNEIQVIDTFTYSAGIITLSLSSDSQPAKTINISGVNTDNQIIDTFEIVSNVLRLSVEDDGQPFKSVNLAPYLDNTDNQNLSYAPATGIMSISGGTGDTINLMVGATGVASGQRGLVPQPLAGDNTMFLRGDGTWANPTTGGDNWGSQVVQRDSSLKGNGTSGNPLGIKNYATANNGEVPSKVASGIDWVPIDTSVTNEIQRLDTFEIVSNTLRASLLNDGVPFSSVDLTPYLDNTDDQTLSLDSAATTGGQNFILDIEDGNSVSWFIPDAEAYNIYNSNGFFPPNLNRQARLDSLSNLYFYYPNGNPILQLYGGDDSLSTEGLAKISSASTNAYIIVRDNNDDADIDMRFSNDGSALIRSQNNKASLQITSDAVEFTVLNFANETFGFVSDTVNRRSYIRSVTSAGDDENRIGFDGVNAGDGVYIQLNGIAPTEGQTLRAGGDGTLYYSDLDSSSTNEFQTLILDSTIVGGIERFELTIDPDGNTVYFDIPQNTDDQTLTIDSSATTDGQNFTLEIEDGNIVSWFIPTVSQTIYNASSSLISDRVVSLDSYTLTFEHIDGARSSTIYQDSTEIVSQVVTEDGAIIESLTNYQDWNGATKQYFVDIDHSGTSAEVQLVAGYDNGDVQILFTLTQGLSGSSLTLDTVGIKINTIGGTGTNGQILHSDGTYTYWDDAPSGVTDLTFTGASSPYTLNSSTGTDVTFAAGTGISLSRVSNELTITNTITDTDDQTLSLDSAIVGSLERFELSIDNGNTVYFDVPQNTDAQNLTIEGIGPTYDIAISSGTDVTIQGGGIITLSESPANTLIITGTEVDGSTTNEIQQIDTFSINAAIISASLSLDGVPAKTLDITESVQDLVGEMVTGNTETGITVTYEDSDGTLDFVAADVSATNEIQRLDTFEIVSNVLRASLLNDGVPFSSVNLAPYLDNTDAQTLSWNGTTEELTISGGNTVDLGLDAKYLPLTADNIASNQIAYGTGTGITSSFPIKVNTAIAASSINKTYKVRVSGENGSTYSGFGADSIASGQIAFAASNVENSATAWYASWLKKEDGTGDVASIIQHVNASSVADAIMWLITPVSGGDPIVQYTAGSANVASGIDNSDSDIWKVDYASSLDATYAIGVNSSNLVSIGGAPVTGKALAVTGEVQISDLNATTTATVVLGADGSGNVESLGLSTGLSVSSGTLTVADQSATNELQTFSNTSDATTHTVTLSNSGGSIQLVEGTGITLTTGGTALSGTVTIASTVSSYTDEQAQDAVGGILVDSDWIDFTYDNATPEITAEIIAASITNTELDDGVGGIYKGSGNVAIGAVATVQTDFEIEYTDGSPALLFDGAFETIQMLSGGGSDISLGSNIVYSTGATHTFRHNTDTEFTVEDSTVTVGGNTSTTRLRFLERSASGTNYTSIRAGIQSANYEYIWPVDNPASGEVLSWNTGGQLSWEASAVNNIYTDDGTVTDAVRTLTLPENGDIYFDYFGGNTALLVTDDGASTFIYGKDQSAYVVAENTGIEIVASGATEDITIDADYVHIGVGGGSVIGIGSSVNGRSTIQLWDETGDHSTQIYTGEQTSNIIYIWPIDAPGDNEVLTWNTGNQLSWEPGSTFDTNIYEDDGNVQDGGTIVDVSGNDPIIFNLDASPTETNRMTRYYVDLTGDDLFTYFAQYVTPNDSLYITSYDSGIYLNYQGTTNFGEGLVISSNTILDLRGDSILMSTVPSKTVLHYITGQYNNTYTKIEGTTNGQILVWDETNGYWEISSPSGLADADYGDITVTSSGTVWNIDAGVVGNTELASATGGIYKGSGAIASGAVATVANTSSFAINYNGGNSAIVITDNASVIIGGDDADQLLEVNNSETVVYSGTSKMMYTGGVLRLYDSDATQYVALQTPATGSLTSNYTLTLPVDDGTPDQLLKTDGSGNLSWTTVAGGGDILNGGNTTGATVTIGTNDANALNLETNNVARMSITGGASTGGAFTFTNVTANTNTVQDVFTIQSNSTGTAAASFGSGILFQGESSTTDNQNMARISAIWTTATHASRTTAVTIDGVSNAGTIGEIARISAQSSTPQILIASAIGTPGTTSYRHSGIVNTGGTFTIGSSSNQVTLGNSTGEVRLYSSGSAGSGIVIANSADASSSTGNIVIGNSFGYTQTSGTRNYIDYNSGFAPTSGTAVHNQFAFTGTFNQTGGANGITRGIYLNQTLTAVTDFRAIEIAANEADAKGIYQTGSSTTNNFVGNTSFGTTTAPNASALIDMVSTSKGFGAPVMTTAQRDAISSPREGLVVYSSDNDALNLRDGASVWKRLPTIQTILKTADETVNNSSTLQNDDALTFTAKANKKYIARFYLHIEDQDWYNTGLKFSVTVPSATTVRASCVGGESDKTDAITSTTDSGLGLYVVSQTTHASAYGYAEIKAYIDPGASDRTVTLQWAQGFATAHNTRVLAGSWLEYEEIN